MEENPNWPILDFAIVVLATQDETSAFEKLRPIICGESLPFSDWASWFKVHIAKS